MRTRVWCTSLVLAALAVACGDQPFETVPERELAQGAAQQMTRGPGIIALATSSSDDGLSISTDKDDYQPGDTVWFTGAGWPANDTLDILLEDEPATHEPHTWWVPTGEDGTFRDSTYIVDVGDLGVTFTLTATSRATDRWLTVVFTDGNITAATAPTTHAPSGATACDATTKASFTLGQTVCAQTTISVQTPPAPAAANFRVQWVGPAPATTIVQETAKSGINGSTQTDQFIPSEVGAWTVRVCNPTGNCATGALLASATFTVTAAAVATTTSIVSSQNPSASGQSVTFTATVTSGSPATAVTTGSVTFRTGTCAGTILGGPTALNGSGQATFSKSDLAIGSHTIFACYGGAAGFLASSASLVQNVNPTATEIELLSSVNPSVTGQSVTFTATVSSNSNPVTAGQLAFKKGGTDCSDASQVQVPGNLNGSGQITYSAAFDASDSPITIRACYGGSSPQFDPSEAAVVQNVNKASTTTTVGASPSPSVFSQSVTFSVTVAVVSPGVGTPQGNVTLKDGTCAGASLGGPSALNVSGQASFNVTSLSAGAHTVRACYAGNGDFDESSGSVAHTVTQAETSTGLTSSANPSVFSQSVTFTATVTEVSPATATPVGNVELRNGTCASGGLIGGPTAVNASGVATFNYSGLAVGTHTITACYLGNTNFKASDGDVSQEVNKAKTMTSVTSTPASSVFSQSVTFGVTVASKPLAVATPVGNVTLKDGTCLAGAVIGSSTALDAGGEASFTVSTLAVGSHTITACYDGNASFEESDGSVPHTVGQASTATAVTSSTNPSIVAQPVTFDVTVTPVSPAVAVPVGLVTLKDGTCASGTAIGGPTALDGTGAVSFSVSTLSAGPHTVSACYAGNVSFKSSYGSVAQLVKYIFDGLYAPVDRPNTYNVSKAGQAVPLKWRLTDFGGNPVLTLTVVTVKVNSAPCTAGVSTDQLEEYAAGASGLQNQGNGYYQFNWKTPGSYASSCKKLSLEFVTGYSEDDLAYFTFKK